MVERKKGRVRAVEMDFVENKTGPFSRQTPRSRSWRLGLIIPVLLLFSGLYCGPDRAAPATVCDLRQNATFFLCDVAAREAPEDCRPDAIGDATRHRFLLQMTTVSLELLHLENEPGARGPFAYGDSAAVLAAVGVQQCRVSQAKCSCRMTYRRPRLGDLFYDAAACRKSSEFQDDPLYFRGRGCRR